MENNKPYNKEQRQHEARKIIIERELEKARNEVIKSDIEVGFLQRLIDKNINVPNALPFAVIEQNLEIEKENFIVSLERLKYIKELRNAEKDRKAIHAAEKAPAQVEVKKCY